MEILYRSFKYDVHVCTVIIWNEHSGFNQCPVTKRVLTWKIAISAGGAELFVYYTFGFFKIRKFKNMLCPLESN